VDTNAITSLADTILDQTGDAVVYADETGVIRQWNRAAAALFGYSAADAIGQTLDLIIPKRFQPAHWRGFDAALKTGVTPLGGRPLLTQAMHQTGRTLYIELVLTVVTAQDGGPPSRAVAVARDVTDRVERQKAEARARHAAPAR